MEEGRHLKMSEISVLLEIKIGNNHGITDNQKDRQTQTIMELLRCNFHNY